MVAIDLELEYLRYFAQFYCLAKEICSYKNGPKDPLNKGNIFEAACFVLHRFWHKDPPCSQFPDVPVLLLTVLIKQKIVTHSAGKTEDIVYTSALEGMVRLDCKDGFIGRMLQQ